MGLAARGVKGAGRRDRVSPDRPSEFGIITPKQDVEPARPRASSDVLATSHRRVIPMVLRPHAMPAPQMIARGARRTNRE